MSIVFHPLMVKAVVRETLDAVSLIFEVPEEKSELFAYKPGQYLTLKIPVESSENRRAYSISSAHAAGEDIAVTVKKMGEGLVSRYINENIKAGDVIDVLPPLGHFNIVPDPDKVDTFVLLGGGSGVTPLMSILKTILIEHSSKVLLIYSNRNKESVIFYDVLNDYLKKYPNRLQVEHILTESLDGEIGDYYRLEPERLKKIIRSSGADIDNSEFYMCGPGGLMAMAERTYEEMRIPRDRIHKESFTAPLETEDMAARKGPESEIVSRLIKITLYGEEYEFNVEPDDTVLTAAQNAGADPPFSCQIGACSTCRAKLLSGKVYMSEREALTDDEIANGYILTCQSHPLTEDVVIDYDNQ